MFFLVCLSQPDSEMKKNLLGDFIGQIERVLLIIWWTSQFLELLLIHILEMLRLVWHRRRRCIHLFISHCEQRPMCSICRNRLALSSIWNLLFFLFFRSWTPTPRYSLLKRRIFWKLNRNERRSFSIVHIGLFKIRAVHDALLNVWKSLHKFLHLIFLSTFIQHLVRWLRRCLIQQRLCIHVFLPLALPESKCLLLLLLVHAWLNQWF